MPVQNVSQISLPGQFFSRFSTSVVNWHHFANNCTNGQLGRASTPSNKAGFDAKSQSTRPRTFSRCNKNAAFITSGMQAGICIFWQKSKRILLKSHTYAPSNISESVRQKTRAGPERFQGHFTNPAMKPPRCIESFHKNAGQNYSSMRHWRSSRDSSSIRGFIEF